MTIVGGQFGSDKETFPATFKLKVTGGNITGVTVEDAGAYVNLPCATDPNGCAVTGSKDGTGATFKVTLDPDPAGNGVTFILTGSSPGSVQVKNAPVNFTAPKSGPSSGLIFWQDRDAVDGGGTFNGSGNAKNGEAQVLRTLYNGTLDFPNQQVTIAGNANFEPTECTAIVADIIDFQGNGSITKGCLPFGEGTEVVGDDDFTVVE